MINATSNWIFMQPIAVDDLKAVYGRIGVFNINKDGKTHRFVKKIEADNKPGVTVAFVSKSYDPSKASQVAVALAPDQNSGEMREVKCLCNVGEGGGELSIEL